MYDGRALGWRRGGGGEGEESRGGRRTGTGRKKEGS